MHFLLSYMKESMKKSDYFESFIRESTSVQMSSVDGRIAKRSNGEKDFMALTDELLRVVKNASKKKR